MVSERPGFFEELKRRHVWRMAIAYAVSGWLIVQIATQVFPFFNVPDWGVRLVVILVVIGFPVAVAWAWIYELTPGGVRRTAPADSPEARPEHETRQIGRKLNAIIVAVLVLAVALLGWRVLVLRHAPTAEIRSPDSAQRYPGNVAPNAAVEAKSPDTAAVAAGSGLHVIQAIPAKSVAVLPFANESGNKDEQYFSDGLSDDLINALSQFAGLKVISRNSAFQFRDSHDSSAKIGKLLGVAHLLEGSVQRAGDEVRITATLVNASDGSILWSQRYDKPYKDLFALQDDITHSVADALKAKLLTAPGVVVQSDRPPSGNLAAWNAYSRGVSYFAAASGSSLRQAVDAFAEAARLDPRYARAYAAEGFAWAVIGANTLGGAALQHAYAKARDAIDKALRLNSDLAAGYVARGYLEAYGEFDWRAGQADLQHALRLAPHDSEAQNLAGAMPATFGHPLQSIPLARAALAIDPRNGSAYYALSWYFSATGQIPEAERAIRTAISVQPQGVGDYAKLAAIEIQRGQTAAALIAARQESDPGWRAFALALALQAGSDRAAADAALKKLIADFANSSAYQIAEVYALRRDPDNMFKWLDRAWANHDAGIGYLLYDPFILRYKDDPRFAALCKKVGLPTTTDAIAMK